MTPFRPSEPRRAQLPNVGTNQPGSRTVAMTRAHRFSGAVCMPAKAVFFIAALLLAGGCASRRGHDWYSGPPERKAVMRETYDVAMANLRDLYPQVAWRPADFRKIRMTLTIKEPDKIIGGLPHFRMADGTYSRGYYIPSRDGRTYHIVEPRGETDFRTLYVHEWGHVIGDATGIPHHLHHTNYSKFFMERFR
jgi:hypothetical protein